MSEVSCRRAELSSVLLEHATSEAKNPFGTRRSVPIPEGAAFLEISNSTMKVLIREGKARSIKIRGRRRILVSSLLEISERGTQ